MPITLNRLMEAARRDGTPERLVEEVTDALAKGEIKPREFSIRRLFEDTVEDGAEIIRWLRDNPGRSNASLTEAVSSSAFSSINRQLLTTEAMEGYTDAEFIGSQLARTIPVSSKYGQRKPGLGRIGNEAELVGEGQPYPLVGFGEDYIQTPDLDKRGMIVAVTKESIIEDQTGEILERAREVGYWAGYNREYRIISVATGIVNTYNRLNRGVVDTYGDNSGNHDWDNLAATNALVDWTDIDAARLLFDGMTDPNTGTPIMAMGRTILVPQALRTTAERIVNATAVEHVDNQVAANTIRTISGNPIGGNGYTVLTSPLVSTIVGNSTTWFIGDFTKAFAYRQLWDITVDQQPTGNEDEFNRDIVLKFKVSECGAASVEEPRYAVKCTA